MAAGYRSSLQATTPEWMRWAMPSVADIIFVGLLAVIVFTPLSTRLLGDAGIGWHIRTGRQILATHAVPRVDPFSSSMAGKPWFAWEWMYDAAVGELDATLGLNGVVWLTAVVIATVFAWMFRLLMRRGVNVAVGIVLLMFAVVASMIHFLARPHVFSWLFTLIWFWILETSERDSLSGHANQSQRRLWALPALMLVWVNVHGGFLAGVVLLGIFWLAAVWDWFSLNGDRIESTLQKIVARKRSGQLITIGLISLAASLANPYGWKLHAHIFSYLSNRFLMDHIEEFQSPNFHGVAQRCFVVLIIVALAALAARGRQLRMSELLTLLFAVYSGMYAARNIPVSSILLVMIVAPLVWPEARPQGFLSRMQRVEMQLRAHVWPIGAMVLTLVIAAHSGRSGAGSLMNAHFDPRRMPVDAVNYLQQHEVPGPILSPDYWGGYLIYRLYPNRQVVVDDRHDFYGEEFFKSYLKMIHVERGWQDFLHSHEAACLVLPVDSVLANVLMESPNWKQIYSDEVAIVFVPMPSVAITQQTDRSVGNSLTSKQAKRAAILAPKAGPLAPLAQIPRGSIREKVPSNAIEIPE